MIESCQNLLDKRINETMIQLIKSDRSLSLFIESWNRYKLNYGHWPKEAIIEFVKLLEKE